MKPTGRIVKVLIVIAALTVAAEVAAGDPDPPGPPQSTASYSLLDLYLRLTAGAPGTPTVFTEPASGPGASTMYTVDQIMGVAPELDDSAGASESVVLAGRTFWGLTSGEWGPRTGAMPDNGALSFTPTTTPQTIPEGYHDGGGVVEGDTDLVSGNIRSGTDIFGVTGDLQGCFGSGGQGSNCSSTCSCQSGLSCVELAPDLAPDDEMEECILTVAPPPGLPIRYRLCLNWSAMTAAISADLGCIGVFQDGRNPYEYISPRH